MESNKRQIREVRSKIQPENLETKATPKSGFVLCIAPPSLFRDRRIKMKKSNQLSSALLFGINCNNYKESLLEKKIKFN